MMGEFFIRYDNMEFDDGNEQNDSETRLLSLTCFLSGLVVQALLLMYVAYNTYYLPTVEKANYEKVGISGVASSAIVNPMSTMKPTSSRHNPSDVEVELPNVTTGNSTSKQYGYDSIEYNNAPRIPASPSKYGSNNSPNVKVHSPSKPATNTNSYSDINADSSRSISKNNSMSSSHNNSIAAHYSGEDDDDDVDLFGSDDVAEDAEAAKIREERLEAYRKKKEAKPKTIAKSMVTLDIKPWDDETDMAALEAAVRTIEQDGLVWGASKLVPVGFGIRKLQINLVVEDDKVSTDELQETIQEFEDYVQSTDVAAMMKL